MKETPREKEKEKDSVSPEPRVIMSNTLLRSLPTFYVTKEVSVVNTVGTGDKECLEGPSSMLYMTLRLIFRDSITGPKE